MGEPTTQEWIKMIVRLWMLLTTREMFITGHAIYCSEMEAWVHACAPACVVDCPPPPTEMPADVNGKIC